MSIVPGIAPDKIAHFRRRLMDLLPAIRARTPQASVSPSHAKKTEVWPIHLHGQPSKKVIIYLRSAGCFWSMQARADKKGPRFLPGCFDCEHSVAETTMGQRITVGQYQDQFDRAFAAHDFDAVTNCIAIYNEGNFLNPSEVPERARQYMLKKIARNTQIRTVIIESLPRFVNRDILEDIRKILGSDRRVEIAMGLESADSVVRSVLINKPDDLDAYQRAFHLVKAAGFAGLAYVMIKPSLLPEDAAILDGIATVRFAVSAGAEVVSLEPVNAGANNLAGVLERQGLHRVPWLWSVIEVGRSAPRSIDLRFGGLQFAPSYTLTAYNGRDRSHECNSKVREAMEEYNLAKSWAAIDNVRCDCQSEWLRERAESRRVAFWEHVERSIQEVARVLGLPRATEGKEGG